MSKIILGGGLGGLSAAYYLSKSPKTSTKLTLIESSNRLGGWIKSNTVDNGILFEEGPRTIRPHGEAGENTLNLSHDLGLSDRIRPILRSDAAAQKRMIYANGSLHLLPTSLTSFLITQKPLSKPLFMALIRDLRTPAKLVKDESIYDFTSRRFGEEIADYLISSLICGICAGNAKEISVNFIMKRLFDYEQQFGSISKGFVADIMNKNKTTTSISTYKSSLCIKAQSERWSVYSFAEGLETLPKAIENHLLQNNDITIKLNTECRSITFEDGKVLVDSADNDVNVADNLVSALPAQILSKLIHKQHPQLAELLNKINSVSVAVVNLHFDKKLLKSDAFGFLVPPKEQLPILGVIYDSCCFPRGNCTVLTVMMGGYWFEEYFGKNSTTGHILETALSQLRNTLGITEAPLQHKVNILHKCIPQYIVGHTDNLAQINDYIEKRKLPLTLCGASYHGVGVNDVILSAKKAVEAL